MIIMTGMKSFKLPRTPLQRVLITATVLVALAGCDNAQETGANNAVATAPSATVAVTTEPAAPPEMQTQFHIGNKSYLFDVSDHSFDDLQTLLNRAREVSQFDAGEYQDLKIVMILHGPDIEWFTQQNYARNMQLIDLAAELDAMEIIDMKVCETAMSGRGIRREDVPAFIESVPYAPDEIKRLLQNDFINL